MVEKCPAECQKDIKHLTATDKRLEKQDDDQWVHINAATLSAKTALAEAMSRISWGHALTGLGILVALMLAGFKVIHSQNIILKEEFGMVKERLVAVETKMDLFQSQRARAIRQLQGDFGRSNNNAGVQK